MRIVADVPGSGRKHRRPHRFGVFARHIDDPLIQTGRTRSRLQHGFDAQAQRICQRVGHPRCCRVGVGVCGEQGTPGSDQAVYQGAFRRAGRDGVDPAQQQRMMRQQQAVVWNFVDDRRRRIDSDRHRVQRILGVTAHQTDRIPRLRQAAAGRRRRAPR